VFRPGVFFFPPRNPAIIANSLVAQPKFMRSSASLPRAIPSVDKLLQSCAAELAQHGRTLVTESIRTLLDAARAGAQPSLFGVDGFNDDAFFAALRERLVGFARPSQRRVLNLTGTVLHTNLGRAVLPHEAAEAVATAMTAATNLEYDLARGVRGERDFHVEQWLSRLTTMPQPCSSR
jgi:L-seryl-tRNA(Ser) seleniumtransferase